jgi:hypothetical protein
MKIPTFLNWIFIFIFNVILCLSEISKSRSEIWQKSYSSS